MRDVFILLNNRYLLPFLDDLLNRVKQPEMRGIKHNYLEIILTDSSPEFGRNVRYIPLYFPYNFES